MTEETSPSLDVLERNVAEQAQILAGAGCDAIALEMLFDVEHSIAMLKGAQRCGLPISLGIICTMNSDGSVGLEATRVAPGHWPMILLSETLPQILDTSQAPDQLIVTVMHTELENTEPALQIVRHLWDGATAVYPNTGRYKAPGGWDAESCCTPGDFVDACETWIELGARIVGGCCGIGPDHIRELGKRFKAREGH